MIMTRTMCTGLVVPLLILLPVSAAVRAADAPVADQFKGSSPLQWSVRMADSEMRRLDDRLAWSKKGHAKWDYTAGLFTLSLLKLNQYAPNAAYVEFAKKAIGSFITPDGDIRGYKRDDFNIDNVNAGKTVLALWQLTGQERYRKAAELLRSQLNDHPRTSEGGFWHKKRYPSQMWLDGLYMGAPFYAQYAKLFNEPADFDDVARQFRLIEEHTYDPKTGLFYHGWDESKKQEWASPSTGTSANFWGRGVGWLSMACVDVLDYLPADHPARPQIIALLKKIADGVVKYQDPETGLWWQVLDQGGRKGNYLEATASSMFVYSLAKAVNHGYLSRKYVPAILKGYRGIIDNLVQVDGQGQVTLTQCCSVAGLGYGRDGSYEYYLREPVVGNDLKGVGPFILAGIQVQRLLGLPMSVRPHQTKAETGPASAESADP
jgi:unsaturated rhamnogalacturonyl hydrolase